MTKRIFAILVFACVLLSVIAPTSLAKEQAQSQKTPLAAEITDVYDGRDGIVSMTFDDGYYQTALLLQELFEEYDLYGSLMMISESASGNRSDSASPEEWNELFDKGRLEPQNHSKNHYNLKESGDPSYQNEEIFKSEILDSKTALEGYFPEYDILSYAMPYGDMSQAAHEYAMGYYYAIRATTSGVQSLDPSSSTESGSWYKMHSPPVMYPEYKDKPEEQLEWIKQCIDNAVNGWYLPIIHRVGDDNTDLPLNVARQMFSYISELDKAGKVWVTTYSNAIKYVRERQNSTPEAWEEGGDIYVRVSMSEYTDDGKPLSPSVFNHPLTVKVPVPDTYSTVYYTVSGVEYTATSFSEGTQTYVHLQVVPDGSTVRVRVGNSHHYTPWEKNDESTHKRSCTECGTINYGNHNWDNGTTILEATCTTEGTKRCTCLDCGEVGELTIQTNDNHTFTGMIANGLYKAEQANCRHGILYYYSCTLCRAKSEETFEEGEKREHKFGKWKTVQPATDNTDGIKERVCEYDCGEIEREIIPKTAAPATNDSKPTNTSLPLIIGISVGSVVVLGGASVGITAAILSKKKKSK